MQTFMPYSSFKKTARVLDFRRLGKQRIEALDIYRIITENSVGASEKQMSHLLKRYKNHPAVNMWRGHERALLVYGATMCSEWIRRGYKDTTLPKFVSEIHQWKNYKFKMPDWIFDIEVLESHKSKLVYKKSEFYSDRFENFTPGLPYKWPSKS